MFSNIRWRIALWFIGLSAGVYVIPTGLAMMLFYADLTRGGVKHARAEGKESLFWGWVGMAKKGTPFLERLEDRRTARPKTET
jgi:hypothetical protein